MFNIQQATVENISIAFFRLSYIDMYAGPDMTLYSLEAQIGYFTS